MTAATVFYILVNSATEGMALYTSLKSCGCRLQIAPAPRGHTACCGMSLRVFPEDMPQVREALDADASLAYDRIIEIENTINPMRDSYC